MDDLNKIKKKENIMTIILIILLLLFIFVIIFVVSNKDRVKIDEEKPVIDENTYIKLEIIDNTKYLDLYKNANLRKVNFLNVKEVLITNFINIQNEFINTIENNLSSNKEYIDNYNKNNNITDYTIGSEIDSIIIYDFKDNILSLLYLLEEKVDYLGVNNYITNLFIDISTNSIISNETVLTKYNLSKENISKEVFDNILAYHSDTFSNEELNKETIKNNSSEYISKLIENFDNYIYLYFNDESLYLKYNKNDISNFLFEEDLEEVTYSTLKLKI